MDDSYSHLLQSVPPGKKVQVTVPTSETFQHKRMFARTAHKLGLGIYMTSQRGLNDRTMIHIRVVKQKERVPMDYPDEMIIDTVTGTWFSTEDCVRLEGENARLVLEVMDKAGTTLACQVARALGDEV